ncbi:MAG: hypothetical protein LBV45_10625 [Xanthomonadaceae bacterium]|jgi:uncharacterized protein HemX|nr:hypothetical protein [Xanthomonadaceae bacterium]
MSKLTHLADRALEIADHAGSNLKHAMTPSPEQWIRAGMAIKAARNSAKNAGKFAQRNSVVIAVAAAVVGAGVATYLIYHNRRKNRHHSLDAIEQKDRQIQARRAIARRKSLYVRPDGTEVSQD